jgi:hypothetical protein
VFQHSDMLMEVIHNIQIDVIQNLDPYAQSCATRKWYTKDLFERGKLSKLEIKECTMR